MRPVRLLRPYNNLLPCAYPRSVTQWTVLGRRTCSCSPPPGLSATNALSREHKQAGQGHNDGSEPDHRTIGRKQFLFDTHVSSPGAPFFQPRGTHIFQKLTSFLRAQYPDFGFREVLTPTIYKESLWQQSGHWANYKDDMFTVTGNPSKKSKAVPLISVDGRMQPKENVSDDHELEQYGLKPMNCPGHCILFQSKRRSYRDLPIRYAEFSPLHRNEVSGALSGLTRVRRFHQDDGHIFCRPSQVEAEILEAIKFIKMIYKAMRLKDYRFVLSTRPKTDYIGTVAEWNRAEDQLKQALNSETEGLWKENKGDGAFYGPKIDVTVRDSDGKKHQTATIQLDFQLPKRFNLEYDAPAPELEARGEVTQDPKLRNRIGKVTPVMIHRAVLGSLERFMALMLEVKDGKLPFWLSPRQVIVLTVTSRDSVTTHAKTTRQILSNVGNSRAPDEEPKPRELNHPTYIIDLDASGDSIAQKIARAKQSMYNVICVIGEKNVKDKTVDVIFHGQPNLEETWTVVDKLIPGSQAPVQKDKANGIVRGTSGIKLTMNQCRRVIQKLCEEYL